MVSRRIILPLIIVVILSGIGGVLTAQKVSESRMQQLAASNEISAQDSEQEAQPTAETTGSDATTNTQAGRYGRYSPEKVREQYETTILFFHASWCTECRAFQQAFTSQEIPSGTQILEVNYDTETELRKQYGITLQSSFVKVNQAGEQLSKWVGYGKEKSVGAVVENLQ